MKYELLLLFKVGLLSKRVSWLNPQPFNSCIHLAGQTTTSLVLAIASRALVCLPTRILESFSSFLTSSQMARRVRLQNSASNPALGFSKAKSKHSQQKALMYGAILIYIMLRTDCPKDLCPLRTNATTHFLISCYFRPDSLPLKLLQMTTLNSPKYRACTTKRAPSQLLFLLQTLQIQIPNDRPQQFRHHNGGVPFEKPVVLAQPPVR